MNNPNSTPRHDEAQAILEALRQIQDNPELQAEARRNPSRVLDRLNLSGIARSAVTLGITAMGAAVTVKHAQPNGWWN
jgi:hypothetical protein